MGVPMDVPGAVAAFLALPGASLITGYTLLMEGG